MGTYDLKTFHYFFFVVMKLYMCCRTACAVELHVLPSFMYCICLYISREVCICPKLLHSSYVFHVCMFNLVPDNVDFILVCGIAPRSFGDYGEVDFPVESVLVDGGCGSWEVHSQ